MKKIKLSGSTLKIIAAILMVIDHVGVIFFPSSMALRILGRLSFPIFAFMISEGARYTKNKLRYFLTIFSLAAVCQAVYFFFDNGSLYMCILVTFSISILLIYLLHQVKRSIFDKSSHPIAKWIYISAFIICTIAVYYLTEVITIDYGFAGIMTPVFASVPDFRGTDAPERVKKFDNIPLRVIFMSLALIMLSAGAVVKIQYFSLLSVPLLLIYSGERGKLKLKYFFYVFYPLHLVVLEGIYILTLIF